MPTIIAFTQLKLGLKNYYSVDYLNLTVMDNLRLKAIFRFWMIYSSVSYFLDHRKPHSTSKYGGNHVICNGHLVLQTQTHTHTAISAGKIGHRLFLLVQRLLHVVLLPHKGASPSQAPQVPCPMDTTQLFMVLSLSSTLVQFQTGLILILSFLILVFPALNSQLCDSRLDSWPCTYSLESISLSLDCSSPACLSLVEIQPAPHHIPFWPRASGSAPAPPSLTLSLFKQEIVSPSFPYTKHFIYTSTLKLNTFQPK